MPTGAHAETFTVARNPDRDSTLPFLVRLPLPDRDLVLKVRDTWPRTAKVYCHRATHWPDDLLAAVQVRYPRVPIVFCETRSLAEEWAYRFLGAARQFALAEDEVEDDEP